MKCLSGWGPALLASLLVQLLHSGSAVSSHRQQPAIGVVGQLRAVVETRTEELTSQKNIAHGLELTVRELQAEVLNEKNALATETQKEHTMQQKLNMVRAVLDDGKETQEEKGSPVLAALPAAAAMSAVSGATASVDAFHVKTLPALPPLPPLEEGVESFSTEADAGLEPAAEPAPTAVRRQAPQTPQPFEKLARLVKAEKVQAQEPPPFFEALPAVHSSTMTLPAKHEVKAPKIQAKSFAKSAHRAAPVQHKLKVAPMRSPPKSHSQPTKAAKKAVQPTKAKHMRGPAKHVLAVPKPVAVAPAAATPKAANTATTADSGADTGFDALEAQLHEEDRRIQDLDSENALDAMSDGGAPGSTPQAPVKSMPAQQKMDLDAEAPMEDFLNVGAPGPDSVSEVAPLASSDAALALPQMGETMGIGLDDKDAALSDNQFLAQIAH